MIVCCVYDNFEVFKIILLRLQTLIASLADDIPNVRDFNMPVVAWKKNELNSLIVHFFNKLSPDAKFAPEFLPI